jgi:hypothetical protein
MWTTVALTVSLMTAAADDSPSLKIANARFTYGPFGMERTDTKFMPGDSAFLAYDIENASTDKETGKVVYSLMLRLTDSKDNLVFERENKNIEVLNALHSKSQPSFARVDIGPEQPPGTYTLTMTVTDRITKKKDKYTKKFTVLKRRFGFIKVGAPVLSMVGPDFPLTFSVVGYQRDKKKYPRVVVMVEILDSRGKPTLVKPVTMRIPEDAGKVDPEEIRDELGFPVSFPLNRAGRFTIKLMAEDKIAKKVIELDYKITVLDPRKYESDK